MVGTVLLFGWFIQDMRLASPHDAGLDGASMRGPGAQVRARMDRAATVAQTDPTAALPLIDDLLHDLQARRTDTDDPLEADTREALAHEAVSLRDALVLAEGALPTGFRRDFIGQVADGATFSDWALGVPASITIAQAILESNWGKAAPGHNLFGLKGEGPAGSTRWKVVEYKDGRRRVRTASLRAYATVGDALLDHASILASSRPYARARLVAEDSAAYAAALQGTYATDPRYAGKLTGLVARYALDRFDWNARSPWR